MKPMLMIGSAALVVLVLGVGAYVRMAPISQDMLMARPGPMEVGRHPDAGGLKVVLSLTDLPEDAFTKAKAIALATPRTVQVADGEEFAAFVTRSKLWGFPDITQIWVEGERLHLRSHLVFGESDMGVNATRMDGWLAQLKP